jgi:hypothetical protein
MNDDDIVLQPGASKSNEPDEVASGSDADDAPSDTSSEDVSSPRVFDFSSDFNISPVKDEVPPLSKDIKIGEENALPPSKTLPIKPVMPQPVPPEPPVAPTQQTPSATKQDEPARPSINILNRPEQPAPDRPISYREAVENSQNWPFAFKKPTENQPLMNPSASAAVDAVTPPISVPKPPAPPAPNKNAPSSQPVKTIRSGSIDQLAESGVVRPKTDLQRDVSAILPNVSGGAPAQAAPTKSAPSASLDPNIKPIRTYESDVAEALSHRNISTASIAIAENKKKTGEARLGIKLPEKKLAGVPTKPPKKPEPEIKRFVEPEAVPDRAIDPAAAPTGQPLSREEAFRQAAFPPMPRPASEIFKGGAVSTKPEIIPPRHIIKKAFYITLSLVLIGGGLVGGYYLYSRSPVSSVPLPLTQKPAQTTPTQTATNKSLIPSESTASIDVTGKDAQGVISMIQSEIAKQQNPNTIKNIELTRNINGVETQVSPIDIARIMDISVPDVLLRTFQPKWMLGEYVDVSGGRNVFIAVTGDSYQNMLSGMLHWETIMPNELGSYFNAGTTTPKGYFIDEIVKNKDVRAFVTPGQEQTVFLYSLVNNSMLVFSNSEISLSEIISRLENQAYMR